MTTASLSVDKRIAVLLLAIDREAAAAVLRHLSEETLAAVTRAMRELEEQAIDPDTVRAVHEEFRERVRTASTALGDVGAQIESVLAAAFGTERGAEVARRAGQEVVARRPFAMFESLPPADLAGLLAEEHPQIAAVFLAHLAPGKAAGVLGALDDAVRADLLCRVARLDRTPAEAVQRVLDVMRDKVEGHGLRAFRAEPRAWIKAAAAILNHLGEGESDVLDHIEAQDPSLAHGIREQMFTFDDLAALDRRGMQRVLGQIDSRILAVALKAATPEVERNIFANLSQRAGAIVREERAALGAMPLSEVLDAQRAILDEVRALKARGELRVGEVEQEVV